MNTGRVPYEAPEERSAVCHRRFPPDEACGAPRALARGASLIEEFNLSFFSLLARPKNLEIGKMADGPKICQ